MEHLDTPSGHNWGQYLFTVASVINFIVGCVTQSNIAWLVGVIAGLMAIYSGYLTQKEKRLAIRKLKKDLKD